MCKQFGRQFKLVLGPPAEVIDSTIAAKSHVGKVFGSPRVSADQHTRRISWYIGVFRHGAIYIDTQHTVGVVVDFRKEETLYIQ